MNFRKLRIAWSVACAVACVLLCVLWVRSYSHGDLVILPGVNGYVNTIKGVIIFDHFPGDSKSDRLTLGRLQQRWIESDLPLTKLGDFAIPFFYPILILIPLAVAPWIRHFSLRTLLIATALVAAVLGLIAWSMR